MVLAAQSTTAFMRMKSGPSLVARMSPDAANAPNHDAQSSEDTSVDEEKRSRISPPSELMHESSHNIMPKASRTRYIFGDRRKLTSKYTERPIAAGCHCPWVFGGVLEAESEICAFTSGLSARFIANGDSFSIKAD